jgi:hypothetical protein
MELIAVSHDPPQSMPVSVPFFTPSLHEGPAHVPPLQIRLWQSVLATHPTPPVHVLPNDVAQMPPQSTPVSF